MRADRPSSTATLIAAATVFLSADAETRALVPPGAAELCARCLGAVSTARLAGVNLVSRPGLRWLPELAERSTVPGLMRHFLRRKGWIENVARAALAGGVREVAILGAGFDTLAARLAPEFPAARFTEIDHPATQAIKKKVVSGRNLRFLGADLSRTRLESILEAADAPSLFILEGLLMYLDPAQVGSLFEAIARLQRPGSRLVFTQMEVPQFRGATRLTTGLLSLWREPFKSMLAADQVEPFLRGFGYRPKDVYRPELGEIAVLAER